MKLITVLFCVPFFVFVYSNKIEESRRKDYPYTYEQRVKCIEKAVEACESGKFPPFIPSNEEELHSFCSLSLRFVPCYHKEIEKCLGVNPYEGERGFIMRTLEKACDEDSVWHKALSKHLTCIEKEMSFYQENYNETCLGIHKKNAESISKILNIDFNKYEKYDYDSEEEFYKIFYYWCFKWALDFSCLLRNIGNCGTEAENLALEIINSLGYYVGRCEKDGISPYDTAVTKIGLNDKETNRIRYALYLLAENSIKYEEYLNED